MDMKEINGIIIRHDPALSVATAPSRMATKWDNTAMAWSELAERCSSPRRTRETAAEWPNLTKDEQGRIKDVGGFVGGRLKDGIRKNGCVLARSMATLDADYGTPDFWERFTQACGCAALCYTTHSSTQEKPRYRLVVPFRQELRPEEYEPVARRIAGMVGMDYFDDTTYQLPRLFYWPSCPRDGDFRFFLQDGELFDAKALLDEYGPNEAWRDPANWPRSSREADGSGGLLPMPSAAPRPGKAEDPLAKKGIVGAFCRAHEINEAIATFLPDAYVKAGNERYTYKAGHASGGLVIYDGRWAYSNHDTDPAKGMLLNAFDLVRIHRFGGMDGGQAFADPTAAPSYKAMCAFADGDEATRNEVARQRAAEAGEDFSGIGCDDDQEDDADKPGEGTKEEPEGWLRELAYTKGKPDQTIRNIQIILENAPKLAGKLAKNLFTGMNEVCGDLPWRAGGGSWTEADTACLRTYLESRHGIFAVQKTSDAVESVAMAHAYHPIRDYLSGLVWDGTPRLETLIIDYLGAEDTPLTRAMTRKHFAAAVARVFEPGCKYDYCLTLTGREGIGKSTLFKVMGGKWFSDSVSTMDGKESMESLRMAWIIELAELTSMRKSESESVKAFLTKTSDIYRPAYGRTLVEYPRQCVFCGTTNEEFFLKSDTGNRRFWVIQIDPALRKHGNTREALLAVRDQAWAEAVALYRAGEKLYLPDDLERLARDRQDEHSEGQLDEMTEQVARFLDARVPKDWSARTLPQRRAWYAGGTMNAFDPGVCQRDKVCVGEFLCEWLGMRPADANYRAMARKVAKALDGMPGWRRGSTSRHAEGLYGRQMAWHRVNQPDEGGEKLENEGEKFPWETDDDDL